jgi:hypothetical protein
MVTGPSEPFALMSAVTMPGAAAKLITTESEAVLTPSVQFKVRVVEPPTLGYQGWIGSIGPPDPFKDMPESPVGEVRVQAVALPEVQL